MALQIDMPKFTLDFAERLFIAKAGVRSIDVKVDLYSDWKEAVLLNNEQGQALAMRSTGGDPRSPTLNLGSTFFMLNSYRIRPDEADHELEITGNVFADPFDRPLFAPTLGGFTVLLRNVVSDLVDPQVARLNVDDVITLRKIIQNRTHTDPATGIMTVYDDDNTTVLFTASLYEDVAAATPYAAGSTRIDRRNRLS